MTSKKGKIGSIGINVSRKVKVPDINFQTSVLYPIHMNVEGLDTNIECKMVELRQIINNYEPTAEGHTSQGRITDLDLRTILIEYEEYAPEGHTSQGRITDLDLQTILIEYEEYAPEGYGVQGTVTDANIVTTAIETEMRPEGYGVQGMVTGGTLTQP
jgi:hypothetical protein